jgi:pulcherriminic acid synthase
VSVTVVASEELHTERYRRDPFPTWERLRHEAPVHHDEIADAWLVTRYDDVVAVLQDWETFSTQPYAQVFGPVIGRTVAEMDGDEHVRLRRLVAVPFSGDPLRSYEPMIEEVARELVADVADRPRFDAYADYAARLPVAVMAQILGFSRVDRGLLATAARRIMAALEGVEPALSLGVDAHRALGEHLQPLIAGRRRCPHADVISRIVTAEVDGQTLDDDQIKTFVSLLVNAGGDTTSHSIVAVLLAVLERSDVREALAEDPSLWEAAVSETLRRDGPVAYIGRRTTRDVQWHGQRIPAGAAIHAYVASANNDETRFVEPRRFVLGRADLQAGREHRGGVRTDALAGQLGFGLGRHFCIGWQLARAEIAVACRLLLGALRAPRVARGTDPRFEVRFLVRTLDSLEVEQAV